MDYKGNYFKDDDENGYPHSSKTPKRIKLFFKIIMYSISLIVYVIIFFVIFSSCDPGMFDDMIFSERARGIAENSDSFNVYKLQPTDFMNSSGSVQLKNIYYADDADELEIGVMFNLKKITDGKVNNALVYVLTDSNGSVYNMVNIRTASNRKYGYARVCFDRVKLDIVENAYYKFTTSYDFESEYKEMLEAESDEDSSDQESDIIDDGTVYTLHLFSYQKLLDKGYLTIHENKVAVVNYDAVLIEKLNPITELKVYTNNTVITTDEYK